MEKRVYNQNMAEESTVTQANAHNIVEVYNSDINCLLEDPEVHPQGKDTFVTHYDRSVNPNPIIVEAGKTKMFPKYIAEHFKKHLADHILTSQKLPITSPKRVEIEAEIIRGEQPAFSYQAIPETPPQPLEETKTEFPPMDTPQETAVELDTKEDSKTEIKERPTRNELKSELDKLGITYKPYETLDQLEAKIKQFAGL